VGSLYDDPTDEADEPLVDLVDFDDPAARAKPEADADTGGADAPTEQDAGGADKTKDDGDDKKE
jgi:hypothetical protein